jgi:hypothetical protein
MSATLDREAALFQAALALAGAKEREEFLAAACDPDAA